MERSEPGQPNANDEGGDVLSRAGFQGTFEAGRGWYCYPTERFKTVSVTAYWVNPLRPGGVSRAALVPHVLRRASARWPSTVGVERKLEDLFGAGFRADVGKVGDQQLLSFQFEIAAGRYLPGHPDTLRAGFDFMREMLYRPLSPHGLFEGAIVEQERELLRRRILALVNDKGQYAVSRLLEIMADGQGFGLHKLGTVEEVEAVAAETLWAEYETLSRRRPALWFVVGDVDPEAVARYVEDDETARDTREPLTPIIPYQARGRAETVVERQPVQQGKLNLGYHTGIRATDPEYPALVMYAGILGGFPHSKLFLNVREKASLAYYAYSRIDAALGLMLIGAGIEFADFEAATGIIHEQVEAMARGEISDDEMAFTLSALENEVRAEDDSPGQLVGRQLEKVLIGGGLTGDALIQALRRVTKAEVAAVAKRVALDTTYFLTTDQGGDHDHGGR